MKINRRDFVRISAAGAGVLALPGLNSCATNPKKLENAVSQSLDTQNYFEQQFGITQTMMRQVLAAGLAKGGDYCDLFFQHSRNTSVALEDGAVNRGATSVQLGMGVRTTKGDQTGYAFTESLDSKSMLEAAGAAAAIASGSTSQPPEAFAVNTLRNYYPTQIWWSDVAVEQRVPLLEKLNTLVFAKDKRVIKVRASIADEESIILIADSTGQIYTDRQPMVVVRLACTLEDGTKQEENHDSFGARAGLEALRPELLEQLASTCVERAIRNLDAIKPPAGALPVVLTAGSSGILLHEAIGHGMEADFNRKGTSVYSDSVGKPIAQPFVSIIDDGTIENTRGAINVDDEGTVSKRTVLVENGILKSYMHDRISANHYKVDPTGSGRRQSFRHAPLPRMRNTYMLNGPHSREEIITSVKKGVICETFTNGEVNIGAGDFTFYVKNGYLIEDGKVTAPIKDFNIIGNGPDVLSKVTMVANDMKIDDSPWTCGKGGQRVPVSLGMPTCLVSSITVGGIDKEVA